MGRRALLVAVASILWLPLSGCLNSPTGVGENRDSGDNGNSSDTTGGENRDGGDNGNSSDTTGGGENRDGGDNGEDAENREELYLWLYNYRDEVASFTVEVETDGEKIVSDTFELEAPETIFTSKVVAAIPRGTTKTTLRAAVDFADQQEEVNQSFKLPMEDPIAGFEVRLDKHGTLGINIVPYESPD